MKQLGLSDFLELKARRENGEQIKEYKSEFLGGSIIVKKISPYKVTEILDKIEMEENAATNGLKGNIELIYRHCPDFTKKDLQEAFNCVEPYDIVLKVFDNNIGQIGNFATYILSLYGLGKYEDKKEENKIGDGIKNS
nr:MAG TPA: protein yqbN [Caudoviricetes sp.]